MRSRFALIFAGIAAVAAGTWYAIRTDPATPRASARVSPDRQPDTAPPVRVPPTRIEPPGRVPPTRTVPPVLVSPDRISDGGAAGANGATAGEVHAAYDVEARDAAWADAVEPEVRERAERAALAAGAKGIAVECRATRCRIAVDAVDEATMGRVIARLEDSAGLDGLADALVLTSPEQLGDGLHRMHLYAIFDR